MMELYIKEMSDNRALLLTNSGHVLAVFNNMNTAINECSEWLSENDYYSDYNECYFLD